MQISSIRAAALALAVLIGGCAQPIALKATREVPAVESAAGRFTQSKAAPLKPACEVYLTGVSDAREQGSEVSTNLGVPIHHDDIVAWLRAGLLAWKTPNVMLSPPPSGDVSPAKLRLDVELRKAHLWTISTSMSANLVVSATITGLDGSARQKIVRGRDTGMNWAASAAEVRDAFDRALRDLLVKLTPELASLCGA